MSTSKTTNEIRLPMSPENMCKSLSLQKWITRRVVKRDRANRFDPPRGQADIIARYPFVEIDGEHISAVMLCPYGQPGQRLRLTSTWAGPRGFDEFKPSDIIKGCNLVGSKPCLWISGRDGDKPEWAGKSRPAMFVPESLYPLFPLSIVKKVRLERVQDISEADAIAEGISPTEVAARGWVDARVGFRLLWNSINEKRGYAWDQNDWVWVIEYEVQV